MNDHASEPAPDGWAASLEALRAHFPGQKDSVLFCVHKLQQNPAFSFRDLRDEAADRAIPMSGRSLHSAKVLLGITEAKPRRPTTTPAQSAKRSAADVRSGHAIEAQVLSAVRQIQTAANGEATRLRTAIKQAISVLQRALDDE